MSAKINGQAVLLVVLGVVLAGVLYATAFRDTTTAADPGFGAPVGLSLLESELVPATNGEWLPPANGRNPFAGPFSESGSAASEPDSETDRPKPVVEEQIPESD